MGLFKIGHKVQLISYDLYIYYNIKPIIHLHQENYAYFAARLNFEKSDDKDWEFEGEPINNIIDILSDGTDYNTLFDCIF